jgi:hypothetical protein
MSTQEALSLREVNQIPSVNDGQQKLSLSADDWRTFNDVKNHMLNSAKTAVNGLPEQVIISGTSANDLPSNVRSEKPINPLSEIPLPPSERGGRAESESRVAANKTADVPGDANSIRGQDSQRETPSGNVLQTGRGSDLSRNGHSSDLPPGSIVLGPDGEPCITGQPKPRTLPEYMPRVGYWPTIRRPEIGYCDPEGDHGAEDGVGDRGARDGETVREAPRDGEKWTPAERQEHDERVRIGNTLDKYFDRMDKGYSIIPWDTRDGALDRSEIMDFLDSPEGKAIPKQDREDLMRAVLGYDSIAGASDELNPKYAMMDYYRGPAKISREDIAAWSDGPKHIDFDMEIFKQFERPWWHDNGDLLL